MALLTGLAGWLADYLATRVSLHNCRIDERQETVLLLPETKPPSLVPHILMGLPRIPNLDLSAPGTRGFRWRKASGGGGCQTHGLY